MNRFPGKEKSAKFGHIIFHGPFIFMKKSEKSNKKVLRKRHMGHFWAQLTPINSDFMLTKTSYKDRYTVF